jgi:glucokinase
VTTTEGKVLLGVDIGGTKVAAGVVSPSGEILHTSRTRMIARRSAGEGFEAVLNAVDGAFRNRLARKVRGIGISVPGWVDSKRGVLLAATNLPCWRDFPLAREIEKRYGLETRLANDANVAALAEAAWGAGKGYRSVFYITLGTGIGTGMVLQHKIYEGRTGAAGEGGHTTINFRGPLCGCGKRGCIEMYASGTAIARRAVELLGQGSARRSRLFKMAGGKIEHVTAEIVSNAASAGDALAARILDEAADNFAVWLGNIMDLLEPDVFVVGGGIGHLMMSFLERMRTRLKTWAINPRQQQVPIVEARFGPESALVGAAALFLPRTRLWHSLKSGP